MHITWTVPSRSERNRTYHLTARPMPTGLNWSCTCPAGAHGQRCWHRSFIAAPETVDMTAEQKKIVAEWRAHNGQTVSMTEGGF